MSFKSFLSSVGEAFQDGIEWIVSHGPTIISDAQKAEQLAMPVLTLALPGVAPAIAAVSQTIFAAVLSVEQKFAAMGKQTGTGTQKLAEVLAIIGPTAEKTLAEFGLPTDNTTVTAWVNSIVGFLNGLPAVTQPATKPTTGVPPAPPAPPTEPPVGGG